MLEQFSSVHPNTWPDSPCNRKTEMEMLKRDVTWLADCFSKTARGNELIMHTAAQVRQWAESASDKELLAYLKTEPFQTGELADPYEVSQRLEGEQAVARTLGDLTLSAETAA